MPGAERPDLKFQMSDLKQITNRLSLLAHLKPEEPYLKLVII